MVQLSLISDFVTLSKADAPTKHVWLIKESYTVSMKLKYC